MEMLIFAALLQKCKRRCGLKALMSMGLRPVPGDFDKTVTLLPKHIYSKFLTN